MPYIPKKHRKYNLLPDCGAEVFDYSSSLLDEVNALLPEGKHAFPYSFHSYKEYYRLMDLYICQYSANEKLVALIKELKEDIKERNQKKWWSVLKYLGESDPMGLGLTNGRYYYWPTTENDPCFNGVIDDEAFTSYMYPTDRELWEIAEDPTGMAYRTIYEGEDAVSKEEYESIISQCENAVKTGTVKNEQVIGAVSEAQSEKLELYVAQQRSGNHKT